MNKGNYFIRLFHTSKLLFAIVFLFVLLNLAANFIFNAEHTPVFRWDLYSREIPQQKIYSFLEVKYNEGKALAFPYTWQEPEKLFLTNTLNHFIAMKRNSDSDPLRAYIDHWNRKHPFFKQKMPGLKFYNGPTELKEFPAWYKKYLEQHIQEAVYRIDIYEINVAYLDDGKIKKLSSNLIYTLL